MVRATRMWGALILLLSCSDPFITEDTARGCRNNYDDDGDGLVDCADPSCIASGVCEVGQTACRNGRDDNGDGRIDCQETTCVMGGYCDSAPTACGPSPQSGCLTGQGCYLATMPGGTTTELRCRLAGSRPGVSCSRQAVASLEPRAAHPCPAGQGCQSVVGDLGVCSAYCMADDGCPNGATCEPPPSQTMRAGTCTVPCEPLSGLGCPSAQFRCASAQEALATAFDRGGARFLCVPSDTPAGQARPGDVCVDPPTQSTPRSMACGGGSVCVRLNDGARCRALCDLAAPGCAAGTNCQVIYPTGRGVAFGAQRYGACVP